MSPTSSPKPWTGKHLLVAMLLFFGVLTALDATFLTLAVKTFPGEVSKTPYEDGLAYNRTLEARERQAALGWRAQVETRGEPGRLRVRLSDAAGAPVVGLAVSGELRRPATDQGRQQVAFQETAPGLYEADASAELGAWDLAVRATAADGRDFRAERRLTWR